MAWFKQKPDPISDRARKLNQEIAQLEGQIKRLDAQLRQRPAEALPVERPSNGNGSSSIVQGRPASPLPRRVPAPEPIFEPVKLDRLNATPEPGTSDEHYNDLGVRKYDLPALWRRIWRHFQGPATSNPKLVSYLAAGGMRGLRQLRYEKRVARRRFLVLIAILFVLLLGLFFAFERWRL